MKPRPLAARLARALTTTILSVAVASILMVAGFRWLPVPVTAFMIRERLAAGGDGRFFVQRHDWVPWERISKHAAVAAIAAEDQKFLVHSGFDYDEIGKAFSDARRGRRLRGASTISQQVAKNLFLWSGQSWVRKGLEVWFTVWIEFLWPKRRILEVYLNSAQFDRGVWGVEAASRKFFGKDAARLTRDQAALLAAVLPSPTHYRVVSPGPFVRARQVWILHQMQGLGGTSLLKGME